MKLGVLVLSFSLLIGSLSAQHYLKFNDIPKVMQPILSQHVEQKQVTGQILKNALKVYIDKFDPDRIYLLQSEVNPYLQISNSDADIMLQDYKNNHYPEFEKLNVTIQKSIERSRRIREELQKDSALFSKKGKKLTGESGEDPDLKVKFARTEEELKDRIEQKVISFIEAEKAHFGVDDVMNHQKQTIEILERGVRETENEYLNVGANGVPLSEAQQQNLLVLHILKALASSLDAHTVFYSDTEAYRLKTQLQQEFEGVGIAFQKRANGDLVVSDLSDGGPAAKSGKIRLNDILLKVNGESMTDRPFDKIMEMIRGEKGSKVDLTFQRPHHVEPFTVSLIRQEILLKEDRIDTSYDKMGDGIIGVISLHAFYQNANGVSSEKDVKKAIDDFRKVGPLKGLVLDLRENSGGFLNQAVKVAGLFISNGVIVISKYFNGEEHFYRDIDGKTYYSGPLVVLTSRATASAAEIVAQALQDYGVAIVVGDESTYGKGTIQNQTVTSEQNGLPQFKVTVGKYYTVSGKTPQLEGVKADIVIPSIYSQEHLGEQYLEFTVPNDTIPNEYADDLSDIPNSLRAWYLRYYVPTLQHQAFFWHNALPQLRTESAKRLSSNSDYQYYLRRIQEKRPMTFFKKNKEGRSTPVDFQKDEGVAIVKDMIDLEAQERHKPIANGNLKE